jgi:hypothetical protein
VAERLAAARREIGADLFIAATLRKVSLARLEAAIRKDLEAGRPLAQATRQLAGLTRIQYVFCLPESHDIVLAGPAEGWVRDGAGRAVGAAGGRATLALEDLAAALRAFPPGSAQRPFVGCSIDPDPAALARLAAFAKTIPHVVRQDQRAAVAAEIQRGSQEALGLANIRIFGVPGDAHLAQVLVEADYRMKLIGIGLEPPPVRMPTFFTALGTPKQNVLQRWWFTPNYKCVRASADKLAIELVGQGVQLQTEDKTIGPDGRLMDRAGPPSPASTVYAEAFTKHYPAIAAASPAFAQLRQAVDLLVAAAALRKFDHYGQAGWRPTLLLDEKQFPIQTHRTPLKAACAVNTEWRGNRLVSPSGGGVSILPDEALAEGNLLPDEGGAVQNARAKAAPPAERWWWD